MLSSTNEVTKTWSNNTKGHDAVIKNKVVEENLYDRKICF